MLWSSFITSNFLVLLALLVLVVSNRPRPVEAQDDYHPLNYNGFFFEKMVDKTVQNLNELLDDSRKYVRPEHAEHTYNDKFALVEYLTHAAWRSIVDAYATIGFDIAASTAAAAAASSLPVVVVPPRKSPDNETVVVEETESSNDTSGQTTPRADDVVLYFEATVNCNFVEERQAEVIGHGQETVTTSPSGSTSRKEKREIHRYTEYVWNVSQSYHLYACVSNNKSDNSSAAAASSCKEMVMNDDDDDDDYDSSANVQKIQRVDIVRRSTSTNAISLVKNSPPVKTYPTYMKKLKLPTWWIQQVVHVASTTATPPSSNSKNTTTQPPFSFVIRRDLASCKTPRRNEDVQAVLDFHSRLYQWHEDILSFLVHRMYTKPGERAVGGDVDNNSDDEVPVFHHPIIPVFMENPNSIEEPVRLLSPSHADRLLAEQKEALQQKVDALKQVYPEPNDNDAMISVTEATLFLQLHHLNDLIMIHAQSVGHVEEMLRNQLVEAVGKELRPRDFEEYMEFHNTHRLFRNADFAPHPFSWAIRARPNQYPVGMVSIEPSSSSSSGKGSKEPIRTLTRHIPANSVSAPPIRIPLNAATSVQLTGDRYLSGWIRYEFSDDSSESDSFQLAARARQFSSFMILVGTMTGPDAFQPKHAMILQNKDEVLIPLITNVLPSAKQFKDAIASLSPEQQEFARAYRAMQLESSVFAVAIVQLKPQLETLLGLPKGALDKEIALTEDLMKLFVEFQIPSDLLSYNEDDSGSTTGNVTTSDKVALVKGYVKSVMDVIESTKKKQLEEEEEKQKARKAMTNDYVYASRASPGASPTSTPSASPALSPVDMPTHGPTSSEYLQSRSFSYQQARTLRGVADQQRQFMYTGRMVSPPIAEEESSSSSSKENDEERRDKSNNDDGSTRSTISSNSDDAVVVEDFTLLPRLLDAKLEKYDTDGYLRSTVIKADDETYWIRRRQENLLTAATTEPLYASDIALEKKKAFDLLDAISQSGALPLASSELHVIIGVTHCFTDSLIATIVEDNINPIAKAEKSVLMLASTVFGNSSTIEMIGDGNEVDRLSSTFPELFDRQSQDKDDDAGDENNIKGASLSEA